MEEHDVAYYRQRAERERKSALLSEDGAVALVHLQLAEAYDDMVLTATSRFHAAHEGATLTGLRN